MSPSRRAHGHAVPRRVQIGLIETRRRPVVQHDRGPIVTVIGSETDAAVLNKPRPQQPRREFDGTKRRARRSNEAW
jgi:hypothetical protein